MNTITIDSGIYQFVASYAAKRKVSVSSIVENFILSLRDKDHMDKVDTDNVESNILPYKELRPELQKILNLSAPLKGTVPEWDLNGDNDRNEILYS